jgi:hypothetical protein
MFGLQPTEYSLDVSWKSNISPKARAASEAVVPQYTSPNQVATIATIAKRYKKFPLAGNTALVGINMRQQYCLAALEEA